MPAFSSNAALTNPMNKTRYLRNNPPGPRLLPAGCGMPAAAAGEPMSAGWRAAVRSMSMACSLDHPISTCRQDQRQFNIEQLRSLKIYHRFELGRLFHPQIGGGVGPNKMVPGRNAAPFAPL